MQMGSKLKDQNNGFLGCRDGRRGKKLEKEENFL